MWTTVHLSITINGQKGTECKIVIDFRYYSVHIAEVYDCRVLAVIKAKTIEIWRRLLVMKTAKIASVTCVRHATGSILMRISRSQSLKPVASSSLRIYMYHTGYCRWNITLPVLWNESSWQTDKNLTLKVSPRTWLLSDITAYNCKPTDYTYAAIWSWYHMYYENRTRSTQKSAKK